MISLQKVSYFYGPRLIFKNLSFDLNKGLVLLLVGDNGAGKSTLLKIISGLSQVTHGQVKVNAAPHQIAFMGHGTFIYPRMTAIQNLKFWSDLYALKCKPDTLDQLLNQVGLRGFGHEQAGRFSRGMAQRLSLARVMLIKPRLLLLDEPSTGLDNVSRQILFDEIEKAARGGATVVWVSHDVDRDLDRADMVLRLSGQGADFFGKADDFKRKAA